MSAESPRMTKKKSASKEKPPKAKPLTRVEAQALIEKTLHPNLYQDIESAYQEAKAMEHVAGKLSKFRKNNPFRPEVKRLRKLRKTAETLAAGQVPLFLLRGYERTRGAQEIASDLISGRRPDDLVPVERIPPEVLESIVTAVRADARILDTYAALERNDQDLALEHSRRYGPFEGEGAIHAIHPGSGERSDPDELYSVGRPVELRTAYGEPVRDTDDIFKVPLPPRIPDAELTALWEDEPKQPTDTTPVPPPRETPKKPKREPKFKFGWKAKPKAESAPVLEESSQPESKSEPQIEPPSAPPTPEVLPQPEKKRKPKRESKPESAPAPAPVPEPEAAPAPMPVPEPTYEAPVAPQEGEITQGVEASEFEKAQAEYLEAASRYQLDSGHAPYASEAEGEADVVGKLKRMLTLQNVFQDYQETVNETLYNLKATRDSRLYYQSMMRGMHAEIGSTPMNFEQRLVDTSVPSAKVKRKESKEKLKKKRSLLGMIGAGFLAAFGVGAAAVGGKIAHDLTVASREAPPDPELDPLMKKAVPFSSVVQSPEEVVEEEPKPASELSPEEARRSRNEPASGPEEASISTRKRGG